MNKKILVVDDEPHIVRLCQVNLERAGYQVVTARDGIEGIEKIKNEKPDLIILDIAMPHKSGVDVILDLLNEGIQIPPIITLTAKDLERQAAQTIALITAYSVYMPKPFTPQDLLALVYQMLSSNHKILAAII